MHTGDLPNVFQSDRIGFSVPPETHLHSDVCPNKRIENTIFMRQYLRLTLTTLDDKMSLLECHIRIELRGIQSCNL